MVVSAITFVADLPVYAIFAVVLLSVFIPFLGRTAIGWYEKFSIKYFISQHPRKKSPHLIRKNSHCIYVCFAI